MRFCLALGMLYNFRSIHCICIKGDICFLLQIDMDFDDCFEIVVLERSAALKVCKNGSDFLLNWCRICFSELFFKFRRE